MASDQIVTAKLVLQAQLELQRLGLNKAMVALEATEPDLAEYLIETNTSLYHDVLDSGATGKQARRIHNRTLNLVLVCVIAVQKAHAALWQDGTGRELGRKLEPPAPEPPPSGPPSGA